MPEKILKPEAWPQGTEIKENEEVAEVKLSQPTNLGGLAKEEVKWDTESANAQYEDSVEKTMQSGANLDNDKLSVFKEEDKEIRKAKNADPYGGFKQKLRKIISRSKEIQE
jgi:hypothetical protein